MESRLAAAVVFLAIALLLWLLGVIVRSRLQDQLRDLVGQLVPVLVLAVLVVGALVVADPEQADRLLESVISSVPKVMVAVVVVILARALGRIVGLFVETALRRVSATVAARGRIVVSGLILAIGVVIAMQQIGISTDIILVLVAAIAFGTALAVALGAGIGAVPLARQIAAGRHVQRRYAPGARVRVGEAEGDVVEVGLATTRIRTGEGRYVDVPNVDFISDAVFVSD